MRPGGGRRKGKDWENAVARILREHGWEAKRGLQARSGGDAADVVTDLPLWIECKAGKWIDICAALDQADIASSCTIGRARLPPVVITKYDSKKPIAIMRLEDFLALCALAFRREP